MGRPSGKKGRVVGRTPWSSRPAPWRPPIPRSGRRGRGNPGHLQPAPGWNTSVPRSGPRRPPRALVARSPHRGDRGKVKDYLYSLNRPAVARARPSPLPTTQPLGNVGLKIKRPGRHRPNSRAVPSVNPAAIIIHRFRIILSFLIYFSRS